MTFRLRGCAAAVCALLAGSAAVRAQDILLPEETIFGKDAAVRRTAVPVFPPPAPGAVVFPGIPEPDFSSAGGGDGAPPPAAEPAAGRIRTIERYAAVSAGGFPSAALSLGMVRRGEAGDLRLGYEGGFTDGSREHSGVRWNTVRFSFDGRDAPVRTAAEFLTGSMDLPGPVFAPTRTDRDIRGAAVSVEASPAGLPVSFSFRDSFRRAGPFEANDAALGVSASFGSNTFNASAGRYELFDEYARHTASAGWLHRARRFEAGAEARAVGGRGARLLPVFRTTGEAGPRFFCDGAFELPDVWPHIQKVNHVEGTAERLRPVEWYRAGVGWRGGGDAFRFEASLYERFSRRFYTWKDVDADFLYEPAAEEDRWASGGGVYLERRLAGRTTLFCSGEGLFHAGGVEYLPETRATGGIVWSGAAVRLKGWVSYTGERRFAGAASGAVPVVNAEISWKLPGGVRAGIECRNVLDRAYEAAPGYPGDGREVTASVRCLF